MCGVKQRVIPGDFKKKMPLQVQCTVPYLCHILLVAGPFGRLIWIFLTWAFSFKEPANVSHLWVLFDILFYFFLHALKLNFFCSDHILVRIGAVVVICNTESKTKCYRSQEQ